MEHTERSDDDVGGTGRNPAGDCGNGLLGVSEVMERYGFRDRRTARGVMDAAGAFVVARRLYVLEADLVAYEDDLRAARRHGQRSPQTPPSRQSGRRPTASPAISEPLPPGWWRKDPP